MTKYVINGVDGHFGSAAAALALESVAPEDLILTSWDVEAIRHWEDKGVTVRQADYDDLAMTTAAFEGANVVLLISTMKVGPVRQQQHQNAIDAAVAAGASRIVYTSYLGAGDPDASWYTLTDHRYTEKAIRESGLTWNFMRDSQYQQAITQMQAAAAIQTGFWYTNSEPGKISMVHRDDCVRSAVALLLGKGEPDTAYDITGPELVSFRECYELMVELSGATIEFVEITDEQMYDMFHAMGVPRWATDDFSASPFPWCSEDMVTNGSGMRTGGMAVLSDAVERLTGRAPISVRDTMKADSAGWPAAPTR